jgi:hypothetical protein
LAIGILPYLLFACFPWNVRYLLAPTDFVTQFPVAQETTLKTRREFLQSALAGTAAFCFSRCPSLAASSSEAKIEVLLGETQGTISPNIYGHFAEHLGRCIYGGVFDPGSPLADERGFRTDVLEAMRKVGVPVLRWPGGNFVSIYHWEDGIGPRGRRIRRGNPAPPPPLRPEGSAVRPTSSRGARRSIPRPTP